MKKIKLTKGKFAIVDDCDYEIINRYKWHYRTSSKCQYASRNIEMPDGKWKTYYMHWMILPALEGFDVVHIDFNGLNNTRENIKYLTHRQNLVTHFKKDLRSKITPQINANIEPKYPNIRTERITKKEREHLKHFKEPIYYLIKIINILKQKKRLVAIERLKNQGLKIKSYY